MILLMELMDSAFPELTQGPNDRRCCTVLTVKPSGFVWDKLEFILIRWSELPPNRPKQVASSLMIIIDHLIDGLSHCRRNSLHFHLILCFTLTGGLCGMLEIAQKYSILGLLFTVARLLLITGADDKKATVVQLSLETSS